MGLNSLGAKIKEHKQLSTGLIIGMGLQLGVISKPVRAEIETIKNEANNILLASNERVYNFGCINCGDSYYLNNNGIHNNTNTSQSIENTQEQEEQDNYITIQEQLLYPELILQDIEINYPNISIGPVEEALEINWYDMGIIEQTGDLQVIIKSGEGSILELDGDILRYRARGNREGPQEIILEIKTENNKTQYLKININNINTKDLYIRKFYCSSSMITPPEEDEYREYRVQYSEYPDRLKSYVREDGCKYANKKERYITRSTIVYGIEVEYRYKEKYTNESNSSFYRHSGTIKYSNHEFTGEQEYKNPLGERIPFNLGRSTRAYGTATVRRYLEQQDCYFNQLSPEQQSIMQEKWSDPNFSILHDNSGDSGIEVELETNENTDNQELEINEVNMGEELLLLESENDIPPFMSFNQSNLNLIKDSLEKILKDIRTKGEIESQETELKWVKHGNVYDENGEYKYFNQLEYEKYPFITYVEYSKINGHLSYPAMLWIEYKILPTDEETLRTKKIKVETEQKKKSMKRSLQTMVKTEIDLRKEIEQNTSVGQDMLISFLDISKENLLTMIRGNYLSGFKNGYDRGIIDTGKYIGELDENKLKTLGKNILDTGEKVLEKMIEVSSYINVLLGLYIEKEEINKDYLLETKRDLEESLDVSPEIRRICELLGEIEWDNIEEADYTVGYIFGYIGEKLIEGRIGGKAGKLGITKLEELLVRLKILSKLGRALNTPLKLDKRGFINVGAILGNGKNIERLVKNNTSIKLSGIIETEIKSLGFRSRIKKNSNVLEIRNVNKGELKGAPMSDIILEQINYSGKKTSDIDRILLNDVVNTDIREILKDNPFTKVENNWGNIGGLDKMTVKLSERLGKDIDIVKVYKGRNTLNNDIKYDIVIILKF